MFNFNVCNDLAIGDESIPRWARDGRSCRVLRSHHMEASPRSLNSLCMVVLGFMSALVIAPAVAEEKQLLEAPMVDWSVARSVFQQAEKWVKDDKVERDVSSRPLLVSGVVAVRVTLRFGGLTLATADALGNADKPNTPADLREMTARATELALVKYHDARDHAIARPQPGEKSKDNAKENVKDKDRAKAPAPGAKPGHIPLEFDLQIAHSPSEILLPASASAKAVYYQFAAGHHGLRLTSTATPPVAAMVWPGNALASNLLPDSQITQLLADAGYGPQDTINLAPKIGRDGGPRLQRLEVIHMVRPFDGQPIMLLTRGNELIPIDAVDMGTVDSMSRRLSRHLVSRIIIEGPSPGSLAGTYLPTSDRYDPIEASIGDTALTAYVLNRRAAQLGAVDANGLEYLNLKEKARVVTDHVRKTLVPLKVNEGDSEAKALLMLTIIESPHLAEFKPDRDKLASALMALPQDKGALVNPNSRGRFSAEGQAILLAALTALYEQTRDDKLPIIIEPALDALWASKLDTIDLVSAMPWMTQATLRLHRINLAEQTDPTARAYERQKWANRVAAMRTLSESLRKKKLVRAKPALGPVDVIGGFDLISDNTDGAPAPDWRSAQVLAFLSSIASDPEVMEGQSINQFKFDVTLSVRYLAQLMVDEPSCFYVRGARRDALDAVRLALWDNRLAVKPSAMTLLAIMELQDAMNRLDRK